MDGALGDNWPNDLNRLHFAVDRGAKSPVDSHGNSPRMLLKCQPHLSVVCVCFGVFVLARICWIIAGYIWVFFRK